LTGSVSRCGKALTALIISAVLAGCGGGSHGGSVPSAPSVAGPGAGVTSANSAAATFVFTFPKPTGTSASARRSPAYLSSATKSVSLQVTDTKNSGSSADIFANVPAALKLVQVANFANLTGNPNLPGQCGTDPSNTGNYKCTAVFQLPIGIDTATVTSWDANGGTGNVLSQQVATETVLQAVANAFAVSLDANATTMSVSSTGGCSVGPVGSAFGSSGTAAVNFAAAYTDLAGKTIVQPGEPLLEIQDNTSTYQSTSGTINATGGTVAFAITQGTQSFTLTPSSTTVTSATVNIKAVPPSGSDGLSYSLAKTFTFSTGAAPPAHNFLAIIAQTGVTSGQVNFYNVTLGGSGGPDTLSAYSTPTLAVTNSINESKPDVDNPTVAAWDASGNLLIANAHNSSLNAGNLACVPAGSITTGTNTATTTTQDVTAPAGMAVDSSAGTVAIANLTTTATYQLSQYVLSGNYTLAPVAQNVTASGLGANAVADLPFASLTAGTMAVALSDGRETDGTNGTSEVVIKSPNGAQTVIGQITTPTPWAVDKPVSLAWDALNSQLVIANNSAFHGQIAMYAIGGSGNAPNATQTHVIGPESYDGNTGVQDLPYLVAAAPNGTIAVAYGAWASGNSLVQVYDNTSSRNKVLGPIPFNGVTDPSGACDTYVYGGNGGGDIVTSITWLSNTKLLLELQDGNNTALQGLYVFDTTASAVPAGFDDRACDDTGATLAFAAAPKQTGFIQLSTTPRGAAWKF
jgi:hypothetical protein